MRCIRRSGLKCPAVFNKKPEKAGSTFPVEIDFGSAQAETRFSAKVLRVISSALADLWQQVPTQGVRRLDYPGWIFREAFVEFCHQ